MTDKNILARVPGQYIARALQTLPKAESAPVDAIMEASIDVPGIGMVRVTAKRVRHKKGKYVGYFWTAEKALLSRRADGESDSKKE